MTQTEQPCDLRPIARAVSALLLGYAVLEMIYVIGSIGTAIAYMGTAVLIACFVASCIWIYHAAADANALRGEPGKISRGWSVGWFFVPIANVLMPYRAFRQNASGLHGADNPSTALPGWTSVRWIFRVLGSFPSTVSARLSRSGETYEQVSSSAHFGIAARPCFYPQCFYPRRPHVSRACSAANGPE